jgi:RNA polymerase sigma-70 factor (ECF subfamily)
MTVSDAELVGRVRRGDLAAYSELVRRHRAPLERFALHLLGNLEEAEDALQETLLRAYRSIGQCRQPERFRAWVLAILANRCRSALSRKDLIQRDQAAEAAMENAVAIDHGEGLSLRQEIDAALARLPMDLREAFLLKHVEELSYEEIAALTGVTIPALKMRVHRACERLRTELKDPRRV